MINLIETVQKYSIQSPIFSSFDYGENVELNLSGDKTYPQLFLEEPMSGTIDENDYLNLSFSLLMLDYEEKVVDYKENTQKIQNFIDDVRNFTEYLDNNGYITEKPVSFITFRDFTGDVCCGIRLDLTVKYMKRC